MGAYIVRRLLWIVVLLFVISDHVPHLLRAADGRPGGAAGGPQPDPGDARGDPPPARARQAAPEQYWNYIKDLVLHFDFGNSFVNNADVRELIFDRLPNTIFLVARRGDHLVHVGVLIGIDLGRQARHVLRPRGDGRRAGRDLGAGLLARPRRAVPLRERHRRVPDLPGHRRLPGRRTASSQGPDADPAVDRAGGRVRRDLRAAAALEPARDDVRGLHPHRAGQGPHRARA